MKILPNNNAKRDTPQYHAVQGRQNAPVPCGTGQAKGIGIKLFSVLFSLLALSTIHYSLLTNPVFAQAKFDTDLGQFQRALGSGQYNKETFDLQSVIGMSGSLYTLLAGCKSTDANCPQSLRTGAVDKLGETIAGIYAVPPASGVYYASTIFERLSPVKPAYAQEAGTGFKVLGPFLAFWKAVRNMVYVLFALGAVILGVMIMFRTKISPQVVMTIQAALPRLVVGLIMVTFSYAIVGFLIDLTYVGVGTFMWALDRADLRDYSAADSFKTYSNAGFGDTVRVVAERGFVSGMDLLEGVVSANWVVTGVSGALAIIVGVVAGFMGVLGPVAATLLPLALGLIIAVVFFLFRILFALAKAYLMLLIFLILGPVFILWGAISGRGVWDAWLRGVLVNLLVFPIVGIIIFLADVLIRQIAGLGDQLWGPPYLGRQVAIIQGMIGLGSIVLMPQVPDILNQVLATRAPRVETPNMQKQFQDWFNNVSRAFTQRP